MNWLKNLFKKPEAPQPAASTTSLTIRGGTLTLSPVKLDQAQAEWQRRRKSATGTLVILIDPTDHAEIKADAEGEDRNDILTQAAAVNLTHFFKSRHDDLALDIEEAEDEDWTLAHQEPDPANLTKAKNPAKTFSGPTLGKTAFLAEIPSQEPWQVLAHFPFGDWNDVPNDQELTAVFHDWFTRFGAVPALISNDVIEFWVEKPVEDPVVAAKLAMEMYILAPDIVDQGTESVEALANSILGANTWFFWWD